MRDLPISEEPSRCLSVESLTICCLAISSPARRSEKSGRSQEADRGSRRLKSPANGRAPEPGSDKDKDKDDESEKEGEDIKLFTDWLVTRESVLSDQRVPPDAFLNSLDPSLSRQDQNGGRRSGNGTRGDRRVAIEQMEQEKSYKNGENNSGDDYNI